MVEVFRTNVIDSAHADFLICQIHKAYAEYEVNFDLEDCDRILRVKSSSHSIHTSGLILLLANCGFRAEVLPDVDTLGMPLHHKTQTIS